MRFAYADPPYYGCAERLYGDHPDAAVYDTLAGHVALIRRLCDEFPDGWALSMGSQDLKRFLIHCPEDARVAAWVKGWCSWKRNVYPAFAWEPVIFCGGRKPGGDKTWLTARDWVQCNVTTGEPVKGAKPQPFCAWIFALLGAQPGDEFVDLFPGSGAVGRAWDKWTMQFDYRATELEASPLVGGLDREMETR